MPEEGPLAGRRWVPLRQLWRGEAEGAAEVPWVRWAWQGGALVWEVRAPHPLAGRAGLAGPGRVEGLWAGDVAECFVAEPGGGYREYHLAPGGAWWSGRFGAPREPRPWGAAEGAAVAGAVQWSERHWMGRQSIALEAREGVRVNFAAIALGPEGRRFFSLAALGGERPDFHRPEEWPLLEETSGHPFSP